MRKGSRQQRGGVRRSVRGMTLIELIVGLAISSVVSLMAAQFFSVVVRLHRTSTEISSIQKDAQTITAQLTRSIMSAAEICYTDNGRECLLMTGREEQGDTSPVFRGEVFYYDRDSGNFYADTGFTAVNPGQNLFNSLRIRTEMGRIATPEYLVSNKVQDLHLSLSRPLSEFDSLGGDAYGVRRDFYIEADLSMQYRESRSYEYNLRAVPRGMPEQITWDAR